MDKLQEFHTFYKTHLIPNLKIVESKRKGILLKLALLNILSISALGIVAYWLIFVVVHPIYIAAILPTVIVMAYGLYLFSSSIIESTGFYKTYKKKVIQAIIQFINPSLSYDKKSYIDKYDYVNSHFFPDQKVKYYGDDHVSGKINDVRIEFSELRVLYKDKKDRSKNNYQFRGIFFMAALKDQLPAQVVIEPRGFTKSSNLYSTGYDTFDRWFQVRLLDEIINEAALRTLLTSEFLESVIRFKKQLHNDIHISFVDYYMYVAIEHDKPLFEPTIWAKSENFDLTHLHFKDLYFPIHIIESIVIERNVPAYY